MISVFIKVTKLLKTFNLAEVINHDVRFSASRTFYPLNDKVLNTIFPVAAAASAVEYAFKCQSNFKEVNRSSLRYIFSSVYSYATANNRRNVHVGGLEIGIIANDGTKLSVKASPKRKRSTNRTHKLKVKVILKQ